MNDFLEFIVPCSTIFSLFFITFGFFAFMRFINYKEQLILAEYGLIAAKPKRPRWLVGAWPDPARTTRPVSGPRVTPKNQTLRDYLEKAVDYQNQIKQLLASSRARSLARSQPDLEQQVEAWVLAIRNLVSQVDHFQRDKTIQRDLTTVPQAIEQLETRLAREANASYQTALERTLQNHQKHLAALEQLRQVSTQAEIQIESTLSALGTIYSHLLTGKSANQVADYAHLSSRMDEEIHLLQDHWEALQEVKLGEMVGG